MMSVMSSVYIPELYPELSAFLESHHLYKKDSAATNSKGTVYLYFTPPL